MSKEETILQAAAEEFLEKGYDAASTAAIAKRVGMTHAMINYYYRNKEQLFIKVLNLHFHGLIERLKGLMTADGDMVEVIVNTATTLFDSFDENRNFPFLLQDISRTHPEFLAQYRELVGTVCMDSVKRHSRRLEFQIREGSVRECTMDGISDMVLSLSVSPFLMVPTLSNVMGMGEEQVNDYLKSHREEMILTLRARYGMVK